jgi:DNA-binding LytR/AlgR family response regulator
MGNEIIRVFIAEDEQPARELLLDYIFKRSELKLEGWSKNGQEAYEKLCEKEFDLVFLDINMPIMTGIEVLEKLTDPPYVIFTTAYDKYAIKAFEFSAIDYLLKPFTQERFNSAVDKALATIIKKTPVANPATRLGLYFKADENRYIISFDDIVYVSSKGRHSFVHTKTKVFETAMPLKEISKKLPQDLFVRTHKQYIVNLKAISHVQYLIGGQYAAFLKDAAKTTLTIGRMYVSELKEKLTF